MTRVICDAALREKLYNLATPIELCDESGRVLARVLPMLGTPLTGSPEPLISHEELEHRRSQGGKTYTTAQVLAYLKGL